MPLLEEVDEGSEETSPGGAESLKAEHRRRRASKARKKKRAEGASASGVAVFRVVVVAAAIAALGYWLKKKAMKRASNQCNMTFSRPKYVPVPVAGYPGREGGGEGEIVAGDNLGYGYRLMRYMDGRLPASDKADPLRPRGIPVLFVPGHLGKYDQARSLGSQAAEMKISSPRRRLDVFTLDLLEESTAMHGSLVWRQAEFLNHAVEAILGLYSDVPAVESVMIVGHSLGGLVARTAFILPSFRVGSITDILTLGTPHERSPWGMDYSYLSLYPCIDSLWRWHSPPSGSSGSSRCWPGDEAVAAAGEEGTDKAAATHEEACLAGDEGSSDGSDEGCAAEPKVADGSSETAALEPPAGGGPANAAVGGRGGSAAGVDAEGLLGNTVLLSLSGGLKDLMVHPSLCVADGLGLEGQSVSFTTDVMDGCGFGVDHLALVWCKQVVGRVIATLSELERLHTMGAGAKERTKVASGVLASSSRHSGATNQGGQFPESAGFEQATETGDEYLMLARALLSDRIMLFFPAWVYVACLVLAAALTRGLLAKSAKDGTLLPVPLLVTPENHLQLDAMQRASRSLWASVRARGAAVTAAFVMSCGLVCVWANGDTFAVKFLGLPSAEERILELLHSLPGGAVAVTVLRLLSEAAISVVRALNPFDGARDALRLDPLSGIMTVYVVSVGLMMVFVLVMTVLGMLGNGIRRMLPPARPMMRLLRSRKFTAVAACVAVVAAHVETFSLPPAFREITLKGELSVVFTILSASLYALLFSIIIFPSHSPVVATHQHLVVLMYAPIGVFLAGPYIAAVGILSRAGGSSHDPFVSPTELAMVSLALLPIVASLWLARRGSPFPSPPSMHAFVAEFQALMADEVARANGGGGSRGGREGGGGSTAAALAAAALERPHGHGACGKCLHADGGQGAIFVETDKERVSVGGGVSLGPGFRVVACDCPQRELAAPSAWCEFCRCVCKVCGGCKEAVRATRATRAGARGGRSGAGAGGGGGGTLADALGPAASVGIVAVVVLYVGLWAFGMRMMAAPCHALIALAVVGTVLCGMHWGLAKEAARGGHGRS